MDFFGKNMPKTVDLATHNAFATSQIGLFISISYFGLVGYTKFYGNRALYKQHHNAHRGWGDDESPESVVCECFFLILCYWI